MKHKTARFTSYLTLVLVFLGAGMILRVDEGFFKSLVIVQPSILSGIVFIIIYVAATTLIWLGPKDILRMLAALFYGPYLSTWLVYVAEMGNAFILFSLSRKLGREFVVSKLKGKIKRLDELTAYSSYWGIFAMRVFLVPFRFMDLGFGLTKISFKKYLAIIAVASPIRIFIFQYLLSLGKDVYLNPAMLADELSSDSRMIWFCLIYVVGATVFLFVFKRKAASRVDF